MSAPFMTRAVPERAWRRHVRFAVEAIDAVTGEIVWNGLTVKVKGLNRAPIVNASGRFVWLAEQGANPSQIEIDPGRLPYLRCTAPAPAPPPPPAPEYNFVTVELAPSTAYPFGVGVTGVRGTLVRPAVENPPIPLDSERVQLQWQDDNQAPPGWMFAPTLSRPDIKGDFVAIVRLSSEQIARTDAEQRMRVRVAVTRANTTKFSQELQIRPGYVADAPQVLVWDQLAIL